MKAERLQKLNRIFEQALQLPAAPRAAFLAEACAGDADLHEQATALLEASAQNQPRLVQPPQELAQPFFNTTLAEVMPGHSIGSYRLLRELGRGGMGQVFLAEDTRLGRRVALKLLPAELTDVPSRVARFQREARAASALSHPNILTIYDFGQAGAQHYIAAEYVEGQTLRALVGAPSMTLSRTLNVVVQIGAALAAAHRAGIIHRDIKPENVMLRPDGYVKVLDFGLAKLSQPEASASAGNAAETFASADNPTFKTRSGMVLGTISYMSPEQAKGLEVDQRTDLFSLGVLLYELLTGQHPFARNSQAETLAALLEHHPPTLAHYAPGASAELQRVVNRALAKERAERYQTANDLLADLKALKERLTSEPQMRRSASSSEAPTKQLPGKIKRPKLGVALMLAAFIIAAVAVFFYFNRTSALTERDTVLLADFDNKTGDAIFDGTLKQALAVQLGQTPFLNFFPEERVREGLRLMGRPADERVTREVGQELCRRQGLKALLAGSIAGLGSNYVITLEAVNGQSGEALAREQTEAASKEQVLRALGQVASQLRAKLGESLRSIQRFDIQLQQATTSSLEALKAFSLGAEKSGRGRSREASALYKRAVELDPNFALAYSALSAVYGNATQLELSAEAAEKAFALRERVTEREKLRITSIYYLNATGELDRAIEALGLWAQIYPQDYVAHNNLSLAYLRIGQSEKALEEAREAIRLNPNFAAAYANLAGAFIRLKRFDEAKANLEQAFQRKLESVTLHQGLSVIASFQGDGEALRQQLDWLTRNANEHWALDLQAWTAAQAGQLRQAQSFSRRAVESAVQRNLTHQAASFAVELVLNEASCGLCRQARQNVEQALALSRTGLGLSTVPPAPGAAFALALCGEVSEAQKLADELASRYPKATLVNASYLPVIRAVIELQRGHADRAIQLLRVDTPYEGTAGWWPAYVRGQAYLRLNQGGAAAAEFQKILDHRNWPSLWLSIPNPLAALGMARAAALAGDAAQARKSYQDFLALWKEADADLPILIEARKEYEQVK